MRMMSTATTTAMSIRKESKKINAFAVSTLMDLPVRERILPNIVHFVPNLLWGTAASRLSSMRRPLIKLASYGSSFNV